MSETENKLHCPCQSGLLFQQCCQRFLESSSELAETAEQLMRSRYCAYVFNNEAYLLATWHPQTRPASLKLEASPNHWIGLKIKSTQLGQKHHAAGMVHFIARYKINGKAHKLEEHSKFEQINGQWFYLG